MAKPNRHRLWSSNQTAVVAPFALLALILAVGVWLPNPGVAQPAGPFEQSTQASQSTQQAEETASSPRGKKLYLRDGSFQIVREYQVAADRVRYWSVERAQWEELPSDMIDWDATKLSEAAESQKDAALLSKIHSDEAAHKAVVVDIDASVEVAPNVFLPEGEGLFILDDNKVSTLAQAETDYKFDKTQFMKQILIPIPIIPSRHTVSIEGSHAKFRINHKEVEFYRRSKNGQEPEIYLIHARIKGDKRIIENLDQLFTIQMAKRQSIPIEKWELVKGVYRLTLSQALAPGEYALAEVVKYTADEPELYVWDFGVDPAPKIAANQANQAGQAATK